MRSFARALLPLLAVSTLAAAPHAGGAPIITLEQLPDHLEVGEPYTFNYVARQHGVFVGSNHVGYATVNGQQLSVLRDGDFFRATYVPKEAGAAEVWLQLGILPRNGANGAVRMPVQSTRRLLPLQIIAVGEQPRALAAGERGRRLFVAKGCISCHRHADIDMNGGSAPELTGRKFPLPWFEQLLSDPASVLPDRGPFAAMPALGLSHQEIGALAEFLTVSARRHAER